MRYLTADNRDFLLALVRGWSRENKPQRAQGAQRGNSLSSYRYTPGLVFFAFFAFFVAVPCFNRMGGTMRYVTADNRGFLLALGKVVEKT